MRIAFICGSAEPGRDGVGDYTRALAAECERLGHATFLLSLQDGSAAFPQKEENCLRLGGGMTWREREKMARTAVAEFAPDFVSLQFVPYAYHPRGISWGLGKRLRGMIGARPVQVMCHEIWIGAETGAPLRQRLMGWLQKRTMLHLLGTLKPRVVQTSNAAYAALLGEAGVAAEVLPLFGSIPVTARAAGSAPDPGGELRFGMFGELHPVWPAEPLFMYLRGMGRKIAIEHMGRIGKGGELWERLTKDYGDAFTFRRHGEQPAARVTEFFGELDFGIATTPLALIGKSGSAAAMLEHGLPVVVNRDDVRFRGVAAEALPEGVIAMGEDLVTRLKSAARRAAHSRLPEIARRFLESLDRAAASTSTSA